MTLNQFLFASAATIGVALLSGTAGAQVTVNGDNIGGVVTGPNGPEAGVWVIAETTDLPTRLIKSVVTDDQGRYLIPELPKANYEVFARGYGLTDSARQGASRARSSTSPPRRQRRRLRLKSIRRSTGIRCSRRRRRASFRSAMPRARSSG